MRPQKGGRSLITTPPLSASFASPVSASTYELTQPENPATASTQVIERSTETLIAPSASAASPQSQIANQKPQILHATERISTTIGAAQKDTARELSAKLAAVRPALWAGLACLPIAGAFAYFGWYSPAIIAAGTGLGLMLFSQAIATHTTLLLVVVCAVAAILLIFRAYERGRLDPLLPDRLDRFPQPSPPTPTPVPATPPGT